MKFNEFLAEARKPFRPNHRAWLDQPGFHCLYVRYGQRRIGNEIVKNVLDIATVETITKGKGTFKRFIQFLRVEHPDLTLYVENAHPRLGRGLLRMGFTRVDDESIHEISSNYVMAARSDREQTGHTQSVKPDVKNRAQAAKPETPPKG